MTYESCDLCPRMCGVNRALPVPESRDVSAFPPAFQGPGFCRCTSEVYAARAALHMWEEPCISGVNGSGTVFFCGCTLGCCFCQNYQISQPVFSLEDPDGAAAGKKLTIRQLADVFLRLQDQGAHNINLVTATQYLPSVIRALDLARPKLKIPMVYNCGGYEREETIQALDGYVDIYLPDLKYFDPELSKAYSRAGDYFAAASKAVAAMIRQAGKPVFEEYSGAKGKCLLMKKGVVIRHMVLPGHKDDSMKILSWIRENLPEKSYYISLMSQYTPFFHSKDHPELNRRITSYEYDKVLDHAVRLGLTDGYMQKKSSAKEEYTPPFNLEGL
ncbi:MAG TPA: radical SAM protein [Candidatus Lachnoclostridium stercoravium]|uniref:Radical SAM protein n=1 Tax=Candidatus Lachnoclostridium stercoravium TaxID=2838633 RepID=A0A9D2HHK2_9FIRM|nr:radical SAM protein [Candidatus Lachnoclostridium stercoravium]